VITRGECDTLIEVMDKALDATVAKIAGRA
jgi:hypothetical protein